MRSIRSLTLDDARAIIAAGEQFATSSGLGVAIAVVDQTSYVLQVSRLEGAGLGTPDAALAKARSAATNGYATEFWAQNANGDQIGVMSIPLVSTVAGGLPVLVDGQLVGAVGVAGGPPHLDVQIAEAGIAALLENAS
ncbi:heme-binding protein [Amycolatopsis sp. ATCC 39116]|uniref:GlcG/HbpS family heme-binding protein n=1 Tax=Amycolatopsis sp. (strain ATCC 39116 / 75iv2) TaxID=385957 RepID=UPI0002625592|nr:heme-binding protein [Amycolatopsis sp. ATCC 39116]